MKRIEAKQYVLKALSACDMKKVKRRCKYHDNTRQTRLKTTNDIINGRFRFFLFEQKIHIKNTLQLVRN